MDGRQCRSRGFVVPEQAINFKIYSAVRRRRRIDTSLSANTIIDQPNGAYYHRPQRRRLKPLAKVSFLSFFLAVSFSNGESKEECVEPSLLKNAINPFRQRISYAFSPREVAQLGDGRRSTEASGIFFDSLDIDGDGKLEPEEVAIFLKDQIGGSPFDTQLEVDNEVVTVMERLDQNHDNGLEMSDVLDYWMQLESLLTTEEVSEWVVYAVQLPSSVGK